MTAARHLLLTVLLGAFLALCTAAPCSAHVRPQRGERPAPELDGARQRWERLSHEERARLRERYERFRRMEPGQRASLEERARFLRASIERIESRLAPQDRERLARLDPEHRNAVLRDMAICAGLERGEHLRGRMPREWRERLEGVPPEERGRVIGELQARLRERAPHDSWEHFARRLGLTREEIEALRALPEAERRARLSELRDRREARDDRPDGRHGPGHGHGTPAGREGGPRPEGPDAQRNELQRRLGAAMRPRPEDVLRFAELPTEERRAQVRGLIRARVLATLRESGELQPADIERLEELPLSEFPAAIRARFPPPECGPDGRGGRERGAPPPARTQPPDGNGRQ